jgi:hypothetical protein
MWVITSRDSRDFQNVLIYNLISPKRFGYYVYHNP